MPGGPGFNSADDDQPTLPPRRDTAQNDDATIAPTGPKPSTSELPQLEDYELIEELGRGGMGVVYKARQIKLDRVVALKMILGGQFASEEDVRRFELEAETAAKLDHPGIVPIFETGHSHGHHFFSMKLIEGKSLADRLEQYQPDARKSVELVIEIARAVHHAHERGVLHRDLKPANILIDNEGKAAVTDLGLAKQLNDDSGLTQTGLVMGSPGFMSPEQAAGKSDVTTSVDVYSMGAILYWLLAGRAPFKAESRLEVILQTIDSEPESVRVHRPDANRELDLICRKALQKLPADRYATAQTFADDLQAWLDGEPLSVKPPSTIDLARLWVRKNFRTVALASGAGCLCGLIVGLIVLMLMLRGTVDFSIENSARLGVTESSWEVSYFGWIRSVPVWVMVFLPPSIVWVSVAIGIMTIGLIKPKSREVGLVAATAAALLSGIIAFTVSLGWGPISDHSIDRGVQDIELISDAMWMDKSSERELAKKALIQRYPGLTSVKTNERGSLVYRKIVLDQSMGIPIGMWSGIGLTLFLTVLPLFLTIMFSGMVWDDGSRGWAYGGKSIELSIYAALISLVMTKFVTNTVGPSPGMSFQLFSLAGIAMALYFGLSDKHVVWRIAGFIIVNVCIFLNFSESANIESAARFAASAKTPADLQTAARYFEKKLARSDDPWFRFQMGVLSAYRGDDNEHAKQCHALLSGFKNVYRPDVAEQIVKVCLLKPDSLTESELATVYELAEIASGYESSNSREWLCFVRALSEMRQHQLQATLDWNRQCREAIAAKPGAAPGYLVGSTHVVDAMALKQNKELDRFQESMAKANAASETGDRDARTSWIQRMVFEVLRDEATESTNNSNSQN